MIDAVGDLQHSPAPVEHESPRLLSFEETCTSPPAADQLRAFSLFQWMTAEQASALGVVFRPISPAAGAAGTLAFVWRSGKIAECASANGRSIVYGSEWDLALLVKASGGIQRIATITELQRTLPANNVLAIGASSTSRASDQDLQALQVLASDLEKSGSERLSQKFLVDFDKARATGIAVLTTASPTRPIGISGTL